MDLQKSSSLIATVAGQAVSEGFLNWRVSVRLDLSSVQGDSKTNMLVCLSQQAVMRRIITRFLAIIPSMAIAIGLGMPGINSLLVASQVVLSIVLPFVILPLLYCTSNKAIMSVRKTRTGLILDDTTTSQVTLTTVDVPPEELQQPRDQDSSIAEIAREREVNEGDDDSEMVDYGNNKLVIAIGVLSWLIIVAANVYVIVELGLGSQT